MGTTMPLIESYGMDVWVEGPCSGTPLDLMDTGAKAKIEMFFYIMSTIG